MERRKTSAREWSQTLRRDMYRDRVLYLMILAPLTVLILFSYF